MTSAAYQRERGREAFQRKAWGEAYADLTAADQEGSLEPDDLERWATAAYLIGREAESTDAWIRAHQEFLHRGDPRRAARCAFWLGLLLLQRGEYAQGSGWLTRARRLLDDEPAECVEQGYLLMPVGLQALRSGDAATARSQFEKGTELGLRFGDRDLTTFGQLGQGQALIAQGKPAAGVALLDEAMIAVTAGEVSPIVAGIVYCAVIDACQGAFDLRRAREWTAALTGWCADQPDLVPYRGQCLVHRAEIMQLRGAWPDAIEEARQATERLSDPPGQAAIGMAYYQQAELHRLRGEFGAAERGYREASREGRTPQPGMALLRLAQDRVESAESAIRTALAETDDPVGRAKILPGYVEIVLAANDVAAARAAVDELSEIAAGFKAPFLDAVSAHATGAVLLAEGDARAAMSTLRRAWRAWQALEVPYEAAKVRVLTALACRRLGDQDTADMELDAARWVFQQLGAAPELARVERLSGAALPGGTSGLTARELQVLRLIAAGKSNRAIAGELVISEHTVARHVQNIFVKLDVTSRTAAAAYAFEHDLV